MIKNHLEEIFLIAVLVLLGLLFVEAVYSHRSLGPLAVITPLIALPILRRLRQRRAQPAKPD